MMSWSGRSFDHDRRADVFRPAFSRLRFSDAVAASADKDAGGSASDCYGYLRIIFCGLIFTFIYNFYASTLRALGDSRSPLIF